MAGVGLKKTAVLAVGAGLVIGNRVALRTGARRRVDGWRRAAGLALRGEASSFVLSAFGLDAFSDIQPLSAANSVTAKTHLARRLAEFLAKEPATHVQIRHTAAEDRAEAIGRPSYTLELAPTAEGPARFLPPERWSDRQITSAGEVSPLLQILCRTDAAGTTDLWVRVNHVGADGVPVQEALSRLEGAWGQAERVLYPTPAEFEPFSSPRPCPGRPDLAQIQTFIDFRPLLKWRSLQNALLPEPMTIAAALLWRLNRDSSLAGKHMGSTVEVAAVDGLGRGVGVVVVRPSTYPDSREGLTRYVRDFNRQVELTRARSSSGCKTLDALAFAPAGVARTVLHEALRRGGTAFGSLGLTIIKDAKVFLAPIGDVAHADGFMAIGSVVLPTRDGGQVGCVTVKGPRNRIADYPALLGRAVGEGRRS
jgi:hypothetical protein